MQHNPNRRDIRTFVRRTTRMNPSQQRAWDTVRHNYVIDVTDGDLTTLIPSDAHVDWDAEFGRSADLVVEIGSGTGDSLLAAAQARPEINLLAFEVYQPAVASTMIRLDKLGISNVRIMLVDGIDALHKLFDDASIRELWTFFPDPWHKKRHHKRRLVTAENTALIARKLAPSALWRLATDWEDYAEWITEIIDACPAFVNLYPDGAPRWEGRVITKYEQRGLDAGREIHDFCYQRIAQEISTESESEC